MRNSLPLVLVLSLLVAGQALAAADTTYFDATDSLIDRTNPVGTRWHELFPNYCQAPYTIEGWADNGNGILDSCDVIRMVNPDGDPECHHVIEVTVTLELTLVDRHLPRFRRGIPHRRLGRQRKRLPGLL